MAGDWIKFEKATVRKPEVATIARLLGVSRHHVIGLLVELWSWIDDVAVDGVVDACVDADVDALMSTPGLAASLKRVGWIAFAPSGDGLSGSASVPKADRHFGKSAKKRALRSEKQRRWRQKSVDPSVDPSASTYGSTREEKRRVTTISPRILRVDLQNGFVEFWSAYPRKKSKGAALKAWTALRPDDVLQSRIVASLAALKNSKDWQREGGMFIPYPATWLNAQGWEDETSIPAGPRRVVA